MVDDVLGDVKPEVAPAIADDDIFLPHFVTLEDVGKMSGRTTPCAHDSFVRKRKVPSEEVVPHYLKAGLLTSDKRENGIKPFNQHPAKKRDNPRA
jgi:hypothetical protein